MDGFALLVGHLLGDYILQNDWMAKNKTNCGPIGIHPRFRHYGELSKGQLEQYEAEWDAQCKADTLGWITCTVHCLLYTLAIWACSFWWMPGWGLAACYGIHFVIDRFRLARKWMSVVGQEDFATGPLSPWSTIVVDNTFHLLTLLVIWVVHQQHIIPMI